MRPSKAEKALRRAQRITPAPPRRYAHYFVTGYQKDDKGGYRTHCRCDGVCLADNPLQAAMRQNQELVQCDKVRVAYHSMG